MLAVSKVAATEEKSRFSGSFPFLTIPYTSCAVFLGHVLASWNPKTLGAVPSYYSAASPRELVPLIVAVDGSTREEEAVRRKEYGVGFALNRTEKQPGLATETNLEYRKLAQSSKAVIRRWRGGSSKNNQSPCLSCTSPRCRGN